MQEYIFITHNMPNITAIKIIAENEKYALIKAYSYFGGNSKLKVEDFNVLCHNTSMERIYEIFRDFTDQEIQYFASVNGEEMVCKLDEVDIIKCQ